MEFHGQLFLHPLASLRHSPILQHVFKMLKEHQWLLKDQLWSKIKGRKQRTEEIIVSVIILFIVHLYHVKATQIFLFYTVFILQDNVINISGGIMLHNFFLLYNIKWIHCTNISLEWLYSSCYLGFLIFFYITTFSFSLMLKYWIRQLVHELFVLL